MTVDQGTGVGARSFPIDDRTDLPWWERLHVLPIVRKGRHRLAAQDGHTATFNTVPVSSARVPLTTSHRADGSMEISHTPRHTKGDKLTYRSINGGQVKVVALGPGEAMVPGFTPVKVTSRNNPIYPSGYTFVASHCFLTAR